MRVTARRTLADTMLADAVIEDANTGVQMIQRRAARVRARHTTSTGAVFHGKAAPSPPDRAAR